MPGDVCVFCVAALLIFCGCRCLFLSSRSTQMLFWTWKRGPQRQTSHNLSPCSHQKRILTLDLTPSQQHLFFGWLLLGRKGEGVQIQNVPILASPVPLPWVENHPKRDVVHWHAPLPCSRPLPHAVSHRSAPFKVAKAWRLHPRTPKRSN